MMFMGQRGKELNAAQVAALLAGPKSPLSRPARVMQVGNSIVDSYGSFDEASVAFFPTSIMQHACFFAGPVVRQVRLSNFSTFFDRFGNVGHGGATLDVITGDLLTSGWLTQLAADAVVPDELACIALPENDIAAGVPTATIKARYDRFIAVARSVFPGVFIRLGTPLPSYTYDTPAKQQTARDIAQYVRDLAASLNYVGVVEQGVTYANDLYQPLALGYVEEAGAPGTGTVHPEPRAAVAAGRAWGQAWRRAYAPPAFGQLVTSAVGLAGSIAATGGATGVTGTQPTGAGSFSFAVPAGYSIASTALQPGWKVSITQTALQGTPDVQMPGPNVAGITPINTGFVEPYVRILLLSGAEQVSLMRVRTRLFYTDASNDFKEHFAIRSTDRVAGRLPDYNNGEVLEFVLPRLLATTAKTIQTVTLIFDLFKKDALGTVEYEIQAMGLLA